MKQTKAALKILEKTADNPNMRMVHGVWMDREGRRNVTNGVRLFRWVGQDFGIPQNLSANIPDMEPVFKKLDNPDLDYVSIRPGDISIAAIKAGIAAAKADGKTEHPYVKLGSACFNARFFIDVLNVTGENVEICVSSRHALEPVFFLSESCEAVLMPVRPYGYMNVVYSVDVAHDAVNVA